MLLKYNNFLLPKEQYLEAFVMNVNLCHGWSKPLECLQGGEKKAGLSKDRSKKENFSCKCRNGL